MTLLVNLRTLNFLLRTRPSIIDVKTPETNIKTYLLNLTYDMGIEILWYGSDFYRSKRTRNMSEGFTIFFLDFPEEISFICVFLKLLSSCLMSLFTLLLAHNLIFRFNTLIFLKVSLLRCCNFRVIFLNKNDYICINALFCSRVQQFKFTFFW